MPQTLDYLSVSPDDRPKINVPAAIGLSCGCAALAFLVSVCAGVWQRFFPGIQQNAGWIAMGLALGGVINGGIGALRATRD